MLKVSQELCVGVSQHCEMSVAFKHENYNESN
jgi:hypothetical protein